MRKAIVSIIIPCFNAAPWIADSLRSVEEQGVSDLEIIVVDDGSTDQSAQKIKEMFPFVMLIQTNNQGPSKARNLGTKISKGDYIQYLDADDMLAPGKIKNQLDLLVSSDADIVYGKWQELVEYGDCFRKEKINTPEIHDLEIDLFIATFWCPPAAYLFKRSIVEKSGGFNEGLTLGEDARFLFDCALQGAKFVYYDDIAAFYRIHKNSFSRKHNTEFAVNCLKSINEIETVWEKKGSLDQKHLEALLTAYSGVARTSFENDPSIFQRAYAELNRLCPGYIPKKPFILRLLSILTGYYNAEKIALRYRKMKKMFTTRHSDL